MLLIAAVALIALAFRLDREAPNRLFPSRAVSLTAPVGLALWILSLHAMTQTSLTLFLPLLLQVVHHVSPIFVNFVTIISLGWTISSFWSAGWSSASGSRCGRGRSSRWRRSWQSPGARCCRVCRC